MRAIGLTIALFALTGCAALQSLLGVAAPVAADVVQRYVAAAEQAAGRPLRPEERAGLRALLEALEVSRDRAQHAAAACASDAGPPADPAALEQALREAAAARREVASLELELAAGVAELRQMRLDAHDGGVALKPPAEPADAGAP